MSMAESTVSRRRPLLQEYNRWGLGSNVFSFLVNHDQFWLDITPASILFPYYAAYEIELLRLAKNSLIYYRWIVVLLWVAWINFSILLCAQSLARISERVSKIIPWNAWAKQSHNHFYGAGDPKLLSKVAELLRLLAFNFSYTRERWRSWKNLSISLGFYWLKVQNLHNIQFQCNLANWYSAHVTAWQSLLK